MERGEGMGGIESRKRKGGREGEEKEGLGRRQGRKVGGYGVRREGVREIWRGVRELRERGEKERAGWREGFEEKNL